MKLTYKVTSEFRATICGVVVENQEIYKVAWNILEFIKLCSNDTFDFKISFVSDLIKALEESSLYWDLDTLLDEILESMSFDKATGIIEFGGDCSSTSIQELGIKLSEGYYVNKR